MRLSKIGFEILSRMETVNCYGGMIEIESKLFGVEHTYVYYNITEELMIYLEDLDGLVLDDIKLNWFISDDEIIEYMQESVRGDRS